MSSKLATFIAAVLFGAFVATVAGEQGPGPQQDSPRFTVWSHQSMDALTTARLINDRVQGRCYLLVTGMDGRMSNLQPVLCQ